MSSSWKKTSLFIYSHTDGGGKQKAGAQGCRGHTVEEPRRRTYGGGKTAEEARRLAWRTDGWLGAGRPAEGSGPADGWGPADRRTRRIGMGDGRCACAGAGQQGAATAPLLRLRQGSGRVECEEGRTPEDLGLQVNGPRLVGFFSELLTFQVPDRHPRGRYKARTRPTHFGSPSRKPTGQNLDPPPHPPDPKPTKPDPLPSLCETR